MNHFRISPEDPKLTAYVLGQLQGDERAAIEAALRDDPVAREFVEETRRFAAQLEVTFAQEPEPLSEASAAARHPTIAERRAAAINHQHPTNTAGEMPVYEKGSKVLRFPQLYFLIGGVAAACVAVIVALHDQKPHQPVRYYTEVKLAEAQEPQPTSARPVEPPAPPAVEVAKSVEQPVISPSAPKVAVSAVAGQPSLPIPVPEATNGSRFGSADEKGGLLAQVNERAASPTPFTLSPSGGRPGTGKPDRRSGFGGNLVGGGDVVMSVGGGVVGSGRAAESSTLAVNGAGGGQVFLTGNTPGHSFGALTLGVQSKAPTTEAYSYHADSDFVPARGVPFSTFAVGVDTASYANIRRFIESGKLPPADAVRIEELLNYFPYRYRAPLPRASTNDVSPALAASLEVADAPWAPNHRLVRIGLKARALASAQRPAANLVFLVDVSGSMSSSNKLPLVKRSMHKLVEALNPEDRVAIVTYAGTTGLALPSTPAAKVRDIEEALESLHAGGGTNGGLGIQLAYDIAKANFVRDGINRVILCTDGDFNMGTTGHAELARLVEEKARSGVALTALGFGMGNLKDSMLELLARKGKGSYGYIDGMGEAEKLLAQQVDGTLMTVAKDVKVQVDFNPARVASYRLIGYENRRLEAQDFNNDAIDGGAVGAGHAITALYEIVPAGAEDGTQLQPPVDASKYAATPGAPASESAELLTVKVRYKEPDADVSRKLEFPLIDGGQTFDAASDDFKFAAAIAEYGMILRQSPHRGRATLGDVIAWASASAADAKSDPGAYRAAFIDLAKRTQAIMQ